MLGYVASQLFKIVWIHNVIMFYLLFQKQVGHFSKEAVAITQNDVLHEVITADEPFTCDRQLYLSQTTFPSNLNTKL